MTNKKEIKTNVWQLENSYVTLPEIYYSKINQIPVPAPSLVLLNESLAKELGLDIDTLKGSGIDIFAGNTVPDGAVPLAQAYAGHQFGYFNMLGDGRAQLIGEHITPSKDRVDVQLKGSGRTPYSRGGDGRAALGPMLREYIISEAMHGLNIPTTRTLAVVTTGEKIIRDEILPGAVMTRIASSHIRVGTFQYAAQYGTREELRALADYTIQRHFPNLAQKKNKYIGFLRNVIARQAQLISKWQLVGFIHGVMNTDNMAISGETIDYGPCAFMNTFNLSTVFSSIDHEGRYAYGNQPRIAGWNLARLAEALMPLLDEEKEKAVEIAQKEVSSFSDQFKTFWVEGMRKKLGIFNKEEEDVHLIEHLLGWMQKHQADYTNTFIALTFNELKNQPLFQSEDFTMWHSRWQDRLSRQTQTKEDVRELMKQHNPAVIPRNHLVEAAIEAAVKENNYDILEQLMNVLSKPYAHVENQKACQSLPPETDEGYQTFCGT